MSLLLLFNGGGIVPPTGDAGKTAALALSAMGASAALGRAFTGMGALGIGGTTDLAVDALTDLAVDATTDLAVSLGLTWTGKGANRIV